VRGFTSFRFCNLCEVNDQDIVLAEKIFSELHKAVTYQPNLPSSLLEDMRMRCNIPYIVINLKNHSNKSIVNFY